MPQVSEANAVGDTLFKTLQFRSPKSVQDLFEPSHCHSSFLRSITAGSWGPQPSAPSLLPFHLSGLADRVTFPILVYRQMKHLICFSKSHYFTTEKKSDKQVKMIHWATLSLSLLLGAESMKKSAQMLYHCNFRFP